MCQLSQLYPPAFSEPRETSRTCTSRVSSHLQSVAWAFSRKSKRIKSQCSGIYFWVLLVRAFQLKFFFIQLRSDRTEELHDLHSSSHIIRVIKTKISNYKSSYNTTQLLNCSFVSLSSHWFNWRTPWRTSRSREATSPFSQFYGARRFMTVLTIAINPILSQTNSVNAFLLHLCKRHFNIIILPLRSKWSPSSMIPHQISSSALCSQKPSAFVLQLTCDRKFHTPICQLYNR